MASGLSKYADKLAARRRESQGRMFQPLTENGAATPVPRPLSWDYHPSHEVVINLSHFDSGKMFPHEQRNVRQISHFRQPHKMF